MAVKNGYFYRQVMYSWFFDLLLTDLILTRFIYYFQVSGIEL
jgi:hypothetical protein